MHVISLYSFNIKFIIETTITLLSESITWREALASARLQHSFVYFSNHAYIPLHSDY